MHRPTEDSQKRETQHGPVDACVRPRPESAISFAVRPEQIARDDSWRADPLRQAEKAHAVTGGEDALFEKFALDFVGLLRRVSRNRARLPSEFEIGIARQVG